MGIFNYFLENIKFEFKSSIRYKFNFILDIIVFSALLSVFFMSDTGLSFSRTYPVDHKWLFLIGYLLWTSSIAAIGSMSTYFPYQAQLGTLTNSLSSSFDIKSILFVDMISVQILQILQIIILTIFSALVWKVDIILSPYLIIPFVLNIIGFYGIGLILAGLSIYFKKINSILFILKLGLLFITDTVPTVPVLKNITSVIPLTLSNKIARNISVGFLDWYLIIKLLVVSLILVLIGVLVFNYLFKKSKIKANILFY